MGVQPMTNNLKMSCDHLWVQVIFDKFVNDIWQLARNPGSALFIANTRDTGTYCIAGLEVRKLANDWNT